MAIRKEEDVFRTLEDEDVEILASYARACDKEKTSKAIKDYLKDKVTEILGREDTSKLLVHPEFAYSVTYRRVWNPSINTQKREIDINGQFVEASVEDLKNAVARLTKVVQIPDMEIGSTIAISASQGV